jgi:hypothetical protein
MESESRQGTSDSIEGTHSKTLRNDGESRDLSGNYGAPTLRHVPSEEVCGDIAAVYATAVAVVALVRQREHLSYSGDCLAAASFNPYPFCRFSCTENSHRVNGAFSSWLKMELFLANGSVELMLFFPGLGIAMKAHTDTVPESSSLQYGVQWRRAFNRQCPLSRRVNKNVTVC